MRTDGDERRRPTRRQQTTTKDKKRIPLADLTNTSSSSLPHLLKEPTPDPKSAPPPHSIPRDTVPEGEHGGASAAPASPPRANQWLIDCGGDGVNCNELEHSVVYTRRIAKGTKCKGKEPCTVSSCPSVEKIRSIKRKLIDDANTDRRKAFSVPYQKPKKKQRYVVPEAINKPLLPQDFVEKQQAYFSEVDAFELPEEVVSECELE